MKKLNLKLLGTCCALLVTNNVIAQDFPAPALDLTLITELPEPATGAGHYTTPDINLYPGGDTGSLSISIPYTTTSTVVSAMLEVCVSDDLSTNFPPDNDAPMEEAIVSSIMGTGSIPDYSFEVRPNPLSIPPATAAQALVAANAGIEEPIEPHATKQCESIDVTSVIQSNGAGNLSFDLGVSAKYSDIGPGDAAYAMIVAAATANDPSYVPEDPYHVWEDYVYQNSKLVVTYATPVQPENIPTLSEWSMIIMMLGLAGFAATRLKEST